MASSTSEGMARRWPAIALRYLPPAGAASFLAILNVFVAWRLFFTEYTTFFGAVDGSFMAMARVMASSGARPEWWPLWNGGMPFEYAYFPFTSVLAAVLSVLTGTSAARSFHFVSGFAYVLGPVSLFFLAYILSGRLSKAFFAGLLYTVVSPSCLILQSVRNESGGALAPRRLYCLAFYGETPHVLAIGLATLALALLVLFLRRRHPVFAVLAGAAVCATVLTNAFGSVTLLLGVVCLLLSGAISHHPKAWLRLALLGLVSYLLISPWLPPSLVFSVSANPGREGDLVVHHRTVGLAVIVAGLAVIAWLAHRWKLATSLRFAMLFCWWSAATALLHGLFGWSPLPQSLRYQLEMEVGVTLAAVTLIPTRVARRWEVVLAVACLMVPRMLDLRAYAERLLRPADVSGQIEYRVAKALDRLAPGERVMAAGSIALWLNAFTSQPQLSGGHNPTAPNWAQQVAVYTIYNAALHGARDGSAPIQWMKAFGVHAVTVSEANGKEVYRNYQNPAQFQGLLPEIWREGGDVIYGVPARCPSLIHVVPVGAIVRARPRHGLDMDEISRFTAGLDDPSLPCAAVRWESWTKATITAGFGPSQALAIQINYFPGWRATAHDQKLRVARDGLGLMYIEPGRTGPTTIILEYADTPEKTIARMAQVAAALALAFWLVFPIVRNRNTRYRSAA